MIGELIKINPGDLPSRRGKPRKPPFFRRTWVRAFLLGSGVAAIIGYFSLNAYLKPFVEKADTFDMKQVTVLEQSSIIVDRAGKEIGRIATENRVPISYTDMPQHLINALIAAEDSNFWTHKGIDYKGVIRALKDNMMAGRTTQGASTITQQLARQTYGLFDKTKERKILEMLVARRIESTYSKEKILEHYLNRIFFGKGFYGIEAAAQGYFSKPAKALTKGEAACIVGLVKNPAKYSPLNNLEAAQKERDDVFDRMVIVGSMEKEEAMALKAVKLTLKPSETAKATGYVGKLVQDEVESILTGGINGKGYRVTTTIDSAVQKAMEDSLKKRLAEVEAHKDYPAHREKPADYLRKLSEFAKTGRPQSERPLPTYLQAAALAVDNTTGAVLAMCGGRDFGHSQYDRVTLARRPAGTVFTPFVYTAAFENGFWPGSRIEDQRMDNTLVMLGATTGTLGELGCERFDLKHDEVTSLRRALIGGKNNSVARLGLKLGMEKVVEFASRCGLGKMPAEPPTTLGRGEVSVKDICLAYTVFPNGGLRPTGVHYVTKIEDVAGKVVYSRDPAPQVVKVTDPVSTWMTHSCLEETLLLPEGTASNAKDFGLPEDMPVAGKTGTHLNSTDLWFAGYSNKVTAAVWMGIDLKEQIYPFAFSRHTSLPIWVDIMNAAASHFPPAPVVMPSGVQEVELCVMSGQLATDACLEEGPDPSDASRTKLIKSSYIEYTRPGGQVIAPCKFHGEHGHGSGTPDAALVEPVAPQVPSASPQEGVSADVAAEDARPVTITSPVVIGEDPYQSVTAAVAVAGNDPSRAFGGVLSSQPTLPPAPVPSIGNGSALMPSPGRATVD